MTTPHSEKLLEIAEQCEQAAGPERFLDAEIYVATHSHENWAAHNRDGSVADHTPRYTASLGAAMTLVPEGCLYGIGNPEGKHHALVSHNPDAMIDPIKAATPALALCAAALRAQASQPKEPSDER